jgi:hypothetical protein
MGMKILGYVGYVSLGLATAGFLWLWLATLITHACNAWWSTRENYRKRMDDKVSELLEDTQVH